MGFHSRAPEVVDAILALVTPAVAAAAPDVRVFDGPVVDGDPADSIHIGWEADPDSTSDAITSSQDWAGLGAKRRNETLVITNAIGLLNGVADPQAARIRGYQLLAIVEDAIHQQPSMGLTFTPIWAGVTSSRLIYVPNDENGLEVWLVFQITVQTRP